MTWSPSIWYLTWPSSNVLGVLVLELVLDVLVLGLVLDVVVLELVLDVLVLELVDRDEVEVKACS